MGGSETLNYGVTGIMTFSKMKSIALVASSYEDAYGPISSATTFLYLTEDAGQSWTKLDHSFHGSIIDFRIMNANTCLVAINQGAGWYGFSKTVDTGKSWEGLGYSFTEGVLAFDDKKWIRTSSVYSNDPGKFTTDSGFTWSDSPGVPSFYYGDIYNSTSGYVVGRYFLNQDEALYKTTDQGLSWDSIAPYDGGDLEFYSELVGYRWNNHSQDFLQVTHDGGISWSDSYTGNIKRYHIINEDVAFLISDDNIVYKTVDGGFTWAEDLAVKYELDIRDVGGSEQGAIVTGFAAKTKSDMKKPFVFVSAPL
jgi:photosystem II stability/assembly factor-like uncharacterized protein